MEIEGNGKNRFHIIVKCPYIVFDEEWEEIVSLLNDKLQEYKNGDFANVRACLEE